MLKIALFFVFKWEFFRVKPDFCQKFASTICWISSHSKNRIGMWGEGIMGISKRKKSITLQVL
nr:MAG TPA: hypothetical protein [Caudoviricetes sp.]